MPRPQSVTVISVLAIVVGLSTLAAKIFVLSSSEAYRFFVEFAETVNARALVKLPVEVHLAHGIMSSLVWIVAGIFMLKGNNWARLLALFWGSTIIMLTFLVADFSLSLYLKSGAYSILLYFLTRPGCLKYFQTVERA